LNKLWNTEYAGYDEKLCRQDIYDHGNALRNQLDLPISSEPLDAEQSKFFKTVYLNSDRVIRKQKG
jgi:hypothetical protein